ncbi:MAG: hypothetical protein M3552_09915 [Planctomycetota bacterium]|nr:hypothetical protein [Planctomycetaceae bacterium]MDQ3330954.1 hypothetical protein [Planctomycetota bacterium]
MRARRLQLLCLAVALPACTALSTSDSPSAAVVETLTELSPGARCRVTLRPVNERMRSDSQLTYEGTVSRVSTAELTLEDASIEATSRNAPAIKTNLPFVDRHFANVCVIQQSLDAPVTIPVAKIERVQPIEAMPASLETSDRAVEADSSARDAS